VHRSGRRALSAAFARKLPVIEPGTAFFWTSGAQGVLKIQRCTECRTWQHPPLPRCAKCHSEAVAPEAVSGRGRIASYTVNYQNWLPNLPIPYIFGVVELAEQSELYVFTEIQAPVDSVDIGQPVTVIFEHLEDVYLPLFKPVETADV
jgi:uncharacterized OB-fold protein